MLNLEPQVLISRLLTLIIALTVHEFSHAWTATLLGDDTARQYGRLTLNPLKHLDLIGSLMLIFAGFGYARPVPINPQSLQRRTPAGVMWVSLAGPLSNFLLAALAAVPLRFHWIYYTETSGLLPSLGYFLAEFIWINLALALFNLIPLAPLDGEKIAIYLLPPAIGDFMLRYSNIGPAILIVVAIIGPRIGINILGSIMNGPMNSLFSLLLGIPL
ncbi:MAG TPA: site-2 protease family protein [Longilinea sp.]|nr:site-2 protease family protein [Longilinea sp.]